MSDQERVRAEFVAWWKSQPESEGTESETYAMRGAAWAAWKARVDSPRTGAGGDESHSPEAAGGHTPPGSPLQHAGRPDVGAWLPIESAPRDGRCVLGWPIYGHDGPREMYWSSRGAGHCWRVTNASRSPQEPTHWQPLPTAPAVSEFTNHHAEDDPPAPAADTKEPT